MRVTVIGCGYLGATHAACMAELGHTVLGMDTDTSKVAALNQDRVVVGFATRHTFAEAALRRAYAPLINAGIPLITTDLATAELVKTAANAFLTTKISFINAIADVCEAAGADVHQLADALSRDPRIGALGMRPGLGFGGGCLPKDIRAFIARAEELGVDQAGSFLREVDAINTRRRTRIVELAREQCVTALNGARITVWGAAFKPHTDDIRDSPALDVAHLLQQAGAVVTVHDPMALDNARKAFPHLNYDPHPADAAEGADLLLHLTEWDDYLDIDPKRLRARVAHPRHGRTWTTSPSSPRRLGVPWRNSVSPHASTAQPATPRAPRPRNARQMSRVAHSEERPREPAQVPDRRDDHRCEPYATDSGAHVGGGRS